MLRRMKEDLRLVSSELMERIRGWFESLGPEWKTQSASVDEQGVCVEEPDIRLVPVRCLLTHMLVKR